MISEYLEVVTGLVELAGSLPDEAAMEIRLAIATSLNERLFQGDDHKTLARRGRPNAIL